MVSEYLKPEVFYDPKHVLIYAAMQQLFERRSPIDLLTVVEQLRSNSQLESVDGAFYLTSLTNAVASSAHIESHAKILVEKYVKRAAIEFAGQLINEGFDEAVDAFDLLDTAEKGLFSLSTGSSRKNMVSTPAIVSQSMNEILAAKHHPQELLGVATGFKLLDRVTCGWQAPDLIIIAARPSVGKTAFALNLARNAAMDKRKPTGVGIFTLEMSSLQLMKRLQSSESKIPMARLLRGNITDEEVMTLQAACERISNANLHFDDTAALNIYELRSRARRMVTQHGVGLIIIDYLQLMTGTSEGRNMNREQEISTISRSLKGLAKELSIPIIALSQLSRESEKRKEGGFQLSDLRESGAIEQDADFVGFLSRTDYQKPDGTVDPMIKNAAQLQIRKHRNGSLDDVPFRTDLSIQQWLDPDDYLQDQQQELPMGSSWKKVGQTVPTVATEWPDNPDDLPF